MINLSVYTVCLLTCFISIAFFIQKEGLLVFFKNSYSSRSIVRIGLEGSIFNYFIIGISLVIFNMLISSMTISVSQVSFSIFAVVSLFSLIVVLSSLLKMKNIVSRYEKLRFLNSVLLMVAGFFITSICLVFEANSVELLGVLRSQNERGILGLPAWGAFYLLPLFYFWITCLVNLERLEFYNVIDKNILDITKIFYRMAGSLLIVFIFLAGDTSYLLLSKIDIGPYTNIVLSTVVMLFKYFFVVSLFRIYGRYSKKISIDEFNTVVKKRLYFVSIFVIVISANWILQS